MRVAKIKDLNVNVWTKMWSNWSILMGLVKNSLATCLKVMYTYTVISL